MKHPFKRSKLPESGRKKPDPSEKAYTDPSETEEPELLKMEISDLDDLDEPDLTDMEGPEPALMEGPELSEVEGPELSEEEKPRRPEKKKKKKMDRRTYMIVVLSLIFAAALLSLFLVILISARARKMPLPMAWNNQDMAYLSVEQSAMQTDTAFSSGLCIGSNNVANENIVFEGNERGGLFSLDDRTVVFSKDMFEKIYPASITKLMTAILAMKSDKMNETVTIQWTDLELEYGSQVVGLRIGDTVTMETLLRGLLIHSGNDAAQAIARTVGGTQEQFVQMMNKELQAIGATGSHFTNPTGLHDDNHYTTVYDIYLMLNEAMKYDEFLSIAQVPVYDFQYYDAEGNEKHVTLDSTDHYLTGDTEPPKDVTVLGGKTGTTSAAGNCLVILAQNAYGQFYISVVVGALSKDVLYEDMNMLLAETNR